VNIMTNGNGNNNSGLSLYRGTSPEWRPSIQSIEQQVGQTQFSIPNVGRIQSPEDANADAVIFTPEQFQKIGIYQVPPAIMLDGRMTLLAADYNVMANYQYVRAAADVVGAEGRNDQTDYEFLETATAGLFISGHGNAVTNIFSPPNLLLGFQIEWGLSTLQFAPFVMRVHTLDFKGRSYQSVDRDVKFRVESNGGSGGVLQFLFGQRMTTAQTCGYGAAPYYTAAGGMNKAIVQPAVLPVINDGADLEYRIVPFEAASVEQPRIFITVPANLADNFTAVCHLLTAGSPFLAATREALFLDGIPANASQTNLSGV